MENKEASVEVDLKPSVLENGEEADVLVQLLEIEEFSLSDDDFSDIIGEIGEVEYSDVHVLEPIIDSLISSGSERIASVLYFEEDFLSDLSSIREKFSNKGVQSFVEEDFLVASLDVLLIYKYKKYPLSVDDLLIFDSLYEFSLSFIWFLSHGRIDYMEFSYEKAKKLKDLFLRFIFLKRTMHIQKGTFKNNRYIKALGFINTHLDRVIESIYLFP